jgi:hypothetical protein
MTEIIEYRGEKILKTAGYYWFNGYPHKKLSAAKIAVDNYLNPINR